MGLRVIAMDGSPEAPGLRIAAVPVIEDVRNSDAAIRIAKEYSVSGVTGFSIEVAIPCIAEVAGAMLLPGLSREAARNATNKNRMREIWRAEGLASAASMPCLSFPQMLQAAEE